MPLSLRSLLSCFNRTEALVNDGDTQARCKFCDVSSGRGFAIVSKDVSVVVFQDRDPAAMEHFLVIPIKHIRSVKTLRRADVSLLRDMEAAGHRALDAFNVAPGLRRLGFHIPPFNSVMHLHLHAHGLPYKPAYRRVKYPISQGRPGKKKGFTWFVEIGQAISILEHDGTIGILPC